MDGHSDYRDTQCGKCGVRIDRALHVIRALMTKGMTPTCYMCRQKRLAKKEQTKRADGKILASSKST